MDVAMRCEVEQWIDAPPDRVYELGPEVVGFRSMLEGRSDEEVERIVKGRKTELTDGMRLTLVSLKAAAESA